ncbi:tetratricopeptide repeat protein [Mucilaginibacter daejeonensis]|uniref:tetratricopeptide repeat protein n=1 Tax=Mucilaginibacter daejeonensis TaxID=398049 RepID=UPI001D1792E5|nr:tetratricopeptide repeat protein [Mucilaginibacter daejeonensis]UEG54498.1 tetratricopeptide repeat protein [Mucilaginibacter daejeonensis]
MPIFNNMHNWEDIYLEAEEAIRNANYLQAKQLLENIILEEPSTAQAHNSLGWLYRTQFDDYHRAENHYKAAIKSDPKYPHAYINLIVLYTNLEQWDKARDIAAKALMRPLVDKALVHYRLGIIEEYAQNFEDAIKFYKQAIKLCLNFDSIEDYKRAIANCEYKSTL